jgi:hypothetical protein
MAKEFMIAFDFNLHGCADAEPEVDPVPSSSGTARWMLGVPALYR